MNLNEIINSDCIEGMKLLPDNSIDCCVTSPPYFGLRDYGHDGQIGLEDTPELFVSKMVEVFTQVYRILKPEGTLWLNLGDSYAAQRGGSHQPAETLAGGKNGKTESGERVNRSRHDGYNPTRNASAIGLKHKDLIGIPWMVAFALRSAGWYLRQDIIWHKPNPMPESVTDRCTKSHEYIFLLSKSAKYYYDHEVIKTPVKGRMKAVGKLRPNGIVRDRALNYDSKEKILRGKTDRVAEYNSEKEMPQPSGKANKKSVWTVTTKPFSEAHFATYPPDLIQPCILAGCPENGVVLDPFMGAGTTALVARANNRNFIGFELNPEYVAIANKRLNQKLGMFL